MLIASPGPSLLYLQLGDFGLSRMLGAEESHVDTQVGSPLRFLLYPLACANCQGCCHLCWNQPLPLAVVMRHSTQRRLASALVVCHTH